MAGSMLPHLTSTFIGSVTVRLLGMDANGLYWAAWTLSGLFSGFVINAMGADYFPRLSAVAHDASTARSLVNEQIEAGLLLGTPGIVAMIVLAPVALNVCYARDFLEAWPLIVLFSCGVAVQIGSWPIGYLILARGHNKLFVTLQAAWLAIHVALAWLGARYLGVVGLGVAFLAFNVLTELVSWRIVHRRVEFRWSRDALGVMARAWGLCALAAASTLMQGQARGIVGLAVVALAAATSLRGLTQRLGDQHRLLRLARAIPVLRVLIRLAGGRSNTKAST
jgi:PST family polysaccharide transporter